VDSSLLVIMFKCPWSLSVFFVHSLKHDRKWREQAFIWCGRDTQCGDVYFQITKTCSVMQLHPAFVPFSQDKQRTFCYLFVGPKDMASTYKVFAANS